jgi:hypothetical protein
LALVVQSWSGFQGSISPWCLLKTMKMLPLVCCRTLREALMQPLLNSDACKRRQQQRQRLLLRLTQGPLQQQVEEKM